MYLLSVRIVALIAYFSVVAQYIYIHIWILLYSLAKCFIGCLPGVVLTDAVTTYIKFVLCHIALISDINYNP